MRPTADIRRLAAHEAPALVEPILRSVPEWFGIEDATRMYIRKSGEMPTWLARVGESPAAFLTIARHFPPSADVFCIAVHRAFHRRGVGRAILEHVERELKRDGVKFLQVKTMGPSKPCREYAETLKFYEAMGFTRLEELHGLWPGMPCLILIKAL